MRLAVPPPLVMELIPLVHGWQGVKAYHPVTREFLWMVTWCREIVSFSTDPSGEEYWWPCPLCGTVPVQRILARQTRCDDCGRSLDKVNIKWCYY